MLVGLAIAVFFFALMLGPADPFAATVGAIPADGAGPNALLQDNVLVAVHPVFLYLGFVGFTIPFSFAIATLDHRAGSARDGSSRPGDSPSSPSPS